MKTMNRRIISTAFFFILLFSSSKLLSQVPLIQSGNSWKYYDQGQLLDNQWNSNNFNDASWNMGGSELGYGDGDENTVVNYGGNATAKHITTYFRKNFMIQSIRELRCRIKFDDGIVLYLNGQEVYRNAMPLGTITYSTLSNSQADENTWYDFVIPQSYLILGDNVFAAEVHQSSAVSSDISFDFEVDLLPLPPREGIFVNELMASNLNSIADQTGTKSDWLEIFNNTNQDLNLLNYHITDNKTRLTKFKFVNSIIVPAKGYKVLWASSDISKGVDHLSWSLSQEGEFVGLVAPDGVTIIDSLSYTAQRTDISFGRLYDDVDSMVYFSPSSPGSKNITSEAYRGFLPSSPLMPNGGFYENSFSIGINNLPPHSSLFYTLDSSTPDSNNIPRKEYLLKNHYPQNAGEPLLDFEQKNLKTFKYSSPLLISETINKDNYISNFSTIGYRYPPYNRFDLPKATVVRAATYKFGYLPSEPETKSYFISNLSNANTNIYTLPVFSINTSEDNLYEYELGITTPGKIYDDFFQYSGPSLFHGNFFQSGKSWERDANVEMFNNTNSVLNNKIGIRIQGNSSRLFIKKSFRLVFDEKVNPFPLNPNLSTKALILKSMRGNPNHDLSMRIVGGMNIVSQRSYPAVSFINGEYWGMYNFMENMDENYIEDKYGFSQDNFDVIKDGEVESGSENNKNQLMIFLNSNNFSSQSTYDSLKALVDVDNFMEFMISEIFTNNIDLFPNNTLAWRFHSNPTRNTALTDLDGRWRWILIDFDGTLENPSGNSFSWILNSQVFEPLLFSRLLQNIEFRNKFIIRFTDLINTHFKFSNTSNLLNHLISQYSPELHLENERWGTNSPQSWVQNANAILGYLQSRPTLLYNQIQGQFQLGGLQTVNITSVDTSKGFVKLNTIDINHSTPGIESDWSSWTGNYFSNIPITLIAKPRTANKFKYWIYNGQMLYDSILTVSPNTTSNISVHFEEIITTENPFPQTYDITSCPYSFFAWSPTSLAGSYPKNSAFCYFDSMDPTLAAKIAGFTTGVYNFGSKSRINGLNNLGLSFINTDSNPENLGYPNGKLGGMVMAINTIGTDSIKINWKGRTILPGPRKYAIRLQYREGNVRSFTDFNPPIEYLGSNVSNDSLVFKSIMIPSEILNKPYVQLLWRYYYLGVGTSGRRDQLAVDDIELRTYKTINLPVSNLDVSSRTFSFYNINSEVSGNNDFMFVNSAILMPGTKIDSGSTVKIENRVCPE